MRLSRAFALSLTIALLSAVPALAQGADEQAGSPTGTLTGAEIDAALLEAGATPEEMRGRIEALLEHEEVRMVAEERGFDMEEARGALGTLSDRQARSATPLVERLEAAMQSGNTITISVYTVIIILLLLILLT